MTVFSALLLVFLTGLCAHGAKTFEKHPRYTAAQGLLSNVFGSHMVFEKNRPINVWGFAPPGTAIFVAFAREGILVNVSASQNGMWRASLPGMGPGGPFFLNVTTSNATLAQSLADVWVGTVILCNGQSNLSGPTTPLSYIFNSTAEIADSNNYPQVRIFQVGEQAGSDSPLAQLASPPLIPWSIASNSSTAEFSAICWMMGKSLAVGLPRDHALGLVESAYSGTCLQVWATPAALAPCGTTPPSQPPNTVDTCLFNSLVFPFTGWTFAGITYYQGESNALYNEAAWYACELPLFISAWRAYFNNPTMWFGIVQLAPWTGDGPATGLQTAQVRDTQLSMAMSLPHVTIATAVDLGDTAAPKGSIHPRPKSQVGHRLGRGALFDMFGIGTGTDFAGPVFSSAVAGPGPGLSATVVFQAPYNGPGALQLADVPPWPGLSNASTCPPGVAANECSGFELMDTTGTWWPAIATLNSDGSALILQAGSAPPGAILSGTSNGWNLWPLVQLYSTRGTLPAFPWRNPGSTYK